MVNTKIKQWLGMSPEDLDKIYSSAKAGELPKGDTRGTAIVAGSIFARCIAAFARCFGWQGKVFDIFAPPDHGLLINKVSCFSLTFVVAKVYKDKSWLDGKETIVIDYSTTSFFAKAIRDEIREVEPGVYLGVVFWGQKKAGKKPFLRFALASKS
ncbi:MAG: hypothetical protein V3W41_17255 [Planctomycetota bacterium]